MSGHRVGVSGCGVPGEGRGFMAVQQAENTQSNDSVADIVITAIVDH